MKHEPWPAKLMLLGFGAAIILLALLWFVHPSPAASVALSIGENIGIGVGSIGLGGYITRSKRQR